MEVTVTKKYIILTDPWKQQAWDTMQGHTGPRSSGSRGNKKEMWVRASTTVFTSLEVASESTCSGLWETGTDPSCLVPGLAYESLEKKWLGVQALDSQVIHLLEFSSSGKDNPSRVTRL